MTRNVGEKYAFGQPVTERLPANSDHSILQQEFLPLWFIRWNRESSFDALVNLVIQATQSSGSVSHDRDRHADQSQWQ